MRSLYLATLLFLLLVLPVLNCTANPAPELGALNNQIETVQTQELAPMNPELTPTWDIKVVTDERQAIEAPDHLKLAISYVGTTELTGDNDGPEIERFLEAVSLAKGNPYCAAFVSFILDETPGIKQPVIRSGLASRFITNQSIDAKEVLRGTVTVPDGAIVIWKKGNTIFGHAGIVESQAEKNLFETIEANTSSGTYGSQRDGDGVWPRKRSIQPGNYFRITHFTRVTYV